MRGHVERVMREERRVVVERRGAREDRRGERERAEMEVRVRACLCLYTMPFRCVERPIRVSEPRRYRV